jgi:hypothetical protein
VTDHALLACVVTAATLAVLLLFAASGLGTPAALATIGACGGVALGVVVVAGRGWVR